MKHVNRILTLSAAMLLLVGVASCSSSGGTTEDTRVADIIAEAEKMDKADLYKKAMEEVNGKDYVVVANSSRMKDSAPAWKEYCQKNYDSTFDFNFSSTQPKNNRIFTQIKADVTGTNHTIAMTLIQDGNQIKNKMTDPGYLLNYIPKEWDGVKAKDGEPLALQSLNKVFCYNNLDGTKFTNVWDFVAEGQKTQFMAPNSEPVGKNFLYMLTQEQYADVVKEAYDSYTGDKTYFDAALKTVDGVAEEFGLTAANAKYSLAWIYLWQTSFNEQTDDGPISKNLTNKSSAGEAGLLVYSKFRSTEETDATSNKYINVAAYQDNYVGFGGFMYKHYLQILKTSPYPWTSCALINFMVTEHDGFYPWGKDMGGYSSSPTVQATFDHSQDGYVDGVNEYPVKNDKGYDWWTANEKGKGRLIIEDSTYAASVSAVLGDWIDTL
ncbi:MAG: hypothetical protein WCR97_02910 [Bacilli bacterium]